jgi:hypothetical protein
MAITTLTNALVLINSVDLSDHTQKVTIDDGRDEKDITAMGATSKAVAKGLGDATITVTFYQDDAAGKVHATLSPLISGTTPFPVEVRKNNAARSATNATALMSGALLFEYKMLDASVGDVPTMDVPFRNASQAGLTYPTS